MLARSAICAALHRTVPVAARMQQRGRAPPGRLDLHARRIKGPGVEPIDCFGMTALLPGAHCQDNGDHDATQKCQKMSTFGLATVHFTMPRGTREGY